MSWLFKAFIKQLKEVNQFKIDTIWMMKAQWITYNTLEASKFKKKEKTNKQTNKIIGINNINDKITSKKIQNNLTIKTIVWKNISKETIPDNVDIFKEKYIPTEKTLKELDEINKY